MKNTVSDRLKQARERRGKTPQEIAEAIGITVESYYDLESTDDLSMVLSLRKILKLCRTLSLTPADLFGWQSAEIAPLLPETLQRIGLVASFPMDHGHRVTY
jgi:transcriptional regulator with XRE-family HTH domain